MNKEDVATTTTRIVLQKTSRFSVLHDAELLRNTPHDLPVLLLSDLLTHQRQKKTEQVQSRLWSSLREYGFVVLKAPRSSKPARVVEDMKQSLCQDFFPNQPTTRTEGGKTMRNPANLQSGEVYVSERGVPMWKVGYELCDDIREAFRIHAGSPDSQPWPDRADKPGWPRQAWLRGLALCRHVCDEALSLTLGYGTAKRPHGSGGAAWSSTRYCESDSLPDRVGDYSVLYAMHYFNDEVSRRARESGTTTGVANPLINVKQHVDPSLFVLEPFLAEREGLQVWSRNEWITCDGEHSPIHQALLENEMGMVLFVGKAFCQHAQGVEPTLHRVIAPRAAGGRRTMIYEQKYEEYFPPPAMD